MKHTYNIDGVTCNNCVQKVTDSLTQINEVETVEVDKDAKTVTVQMNRHVELNALQEALPNKYTLTKQSDNQGVEKVTDFDQNKLDKDQSKWQQLKPLFLILGYISVASFGLHYKSLDWMNIMTDFMGLFFLVFSFFKMLDLKGFPDSFRMYDPLAKRIPFYGKIYPFVESALALMFLFRFQIAIALTITVIVLGITTYGVTKTLLDKKAIRCACLGTALKLPMTEATFIENAIMLVMSGVMLTTLL